MYYDINDLQDITPDFGYFPFTPTLIDIAEGIQAVAFIVLGIGLMLGGVLWYLSRHAKSSKMHDVGIGAFIGAGVAAVVAGSAFGIIRWAGNPENIQIVPNDSAPTAITYFQDNA